MPVIEVKPPRPRRKLSELTLREFGFAVARRVGNARRAPLPADLRATVLGLGFLGYPFDLRRPRTFNERLIWLLLNTVDERRARLADKLAVKEHVAERTPWVRTAETYTAASRGSELRLDALPEVSVLKTNNDSGGVKVLQQPIDHDELVALADALVARDPMRTKPRWESYYLDIPPRVFAEEFLGQDPQRRVRDYRLFTFSGRVALITVQVPIPGGGKARVVLDRDWNYLPVGRSATPGGREIVPDASLAPPRPAQLDDLIRAAETLAEDMPFVRVDMYLEQETVLFGELTFCPNAGFTQWPRALSLELGSLLRLPNGL